MKPLLVSKIEKNAGDVDTNANYCTDIEGIQLFVAISKYLSTVANIFAGKYGSDFILLIPQVS